MKYRHWIVVGIGIVVATAGSLGMPAPSQGAAADDVYTGGHFALSAAASSAGFIQSTEGGGVKAEVVNLRPHNSQEFCNIAIQILDDEGLALYGKDLSVPPGEVQSLELPSQLLANGGEFRVTFRVLDTDKNGKPRPCSALPSVRVFDKALGTTLHYLPIVTS